MNTEFLTIEGTVLKRCAKEATGKIVIPDGVTEISYAAFNDCSSLTEIVIPESVTEIGGAFSNCESLTEIVIPESITKILRSAFSGCKSLTSVVIPESVTEIGEWAFKGCKSLTSVVIPESVTEIGGFAFCDCKSLTKIVIPESVTKIGGWAFRGCSSLTEIVIPESVTEIDEGAFCDCTLLESIVVDPNNKIYDSRENCNAIIRTESNTLVAGCKNTIIPESVTEIGGYAFDGCKSLTSVVIPKSVTEISCFTFKGCESLTEIVIPEGVTKIGWDAFQDCTSLTSVVIPEGVKKIEVVTFGGCTSLTTVVIPEGVAEIGGYAFKGCESLTEIVIPKSVKKIEKEAFKGCKSLEKVSMPERFKGREKQIFGTKLKNIVYTNSELPLYGMRILATGKLQNYSRDEIKKEIIECGGKYSSTVSDKLDFMICGDKVGQIKIDKANELGIKMISEEEFLKMIGKESNTTDADEEDVQIVSFEIVDARVVSYELIDDEHCSENSRMEKIILDSLEISVNDEYYNIENDGIKTRSVEPELDEISEEDLKGMVALIAIEGDAAYDPIDITVKGEFDIDKLEVIYTNYKYKIKGEIYERDCKLVTGFSYDGVSYEIPEYIDWGCEYQETIWGHDPYEEDDE